MDFQERVENELSRARDTHYAGIRSVHEGYSVILEEVDELWDEVKRRQPSPDVVLKELVQIGAMAQRMAEDLQLVPTV